MNKKFEQWSPVIIVGLLAIFLAAFIGYKTKGFTNFKGANAEAIVSPDANFSLKYGKVYSISKMEMFYATGYEVSISGMGEKVYWVNLDMKNSGTTSGSRDKALAFINEKTQAGYKGYFVPSYCHNAHWEGKIYLEKGGDKIDIGEWLIKNNLIYSE